MALGSPAGCIVPQDLRLLWPYPRLCPPPKGLILISAWPCALAPACRGSPIYSVSPLRRAVISTPVAPTGALNDVFPADIVFAATPRRSTTTGFPPIQNNRDVLSKLQCSLYATARTLCLPCSGQDFYFRAFTGQVALKPCVGYHFMAHRSLPWPDLPRPD
jgi:hypothetical protein